VLVIYVPNHHIKLNFHVFIIIVQLNFILIISLIIASHLKKHLKKRLFTLLLNGIHKNKIKTEDSVDSHL